MCIFLRPRDTARMDDAVSRKTTVRVKRTENVSSLKGTNLHWVPIYHKNLQQEKVFFFLAGKTIKPRRPPPPSERSPMETLQRKSWWPAGKYNPLPAPAGEWGSS